MAVDFNQIVSEAVGLATEGIKSLYYHFEPWDGPDENELKRFPARWRNETAVYPKHTPGGARFQKSAMKSHKMIIGLIAANRIGKTIFNAVYPILCITGEIPYAMRYPEGYDTKIKRMMPKDHAKFGTENILRWGRRKVGTNEIIDFNTEAVDDGTWDCGTILGCGIFDNKLICKYEGAQVWVCSYGDIREKTWIPLLHELMPKHCLDTSKGVNGYSAGEKVFHIKGRKQIRFLSYDQGYALAEGEKAFLSVLDESPPDRKFYTGILGHSKRILISWTPIRGMDWSYDDIYEPLSKGLMEYGELFHATRYDCPYTDNNELNMLEKELKAYEIDSKLYGFYARQEGNPYFDYETTRKWILNHKVFSRRAKFIPSEKPTADRDLFKTKIRTEYCDEFEKATGSGLWEIYEDAKPEHTYFLTADCARGTDDPDVSGDKNCAHIFRLPTSTEPQDGPVHCATLYTEETLESFAWNSLYGAIKYNCAIMCPETKGEHGFSFYTELKHYPFWLKMPVVNDRTGRATEIIGFNTNSKTRTTAINKVRRWVNSHEEDPKMHHMKTLIETHEAIWLKGRCDHSERGSTDGLIPWAIALWVFDEARNQLRNNAKSLKKEAEGNPPRILGLTLAPVRETKKLLGSNRGMDQRRRNYGL